MGRRLDWLGFQNYELGIDSTKEDDLTMLVAKNLTGKVWEMVAVLEGRCGAEGLLGVHGLPADTMKAVGQQRKANAARKLTFVLGTRRCREREG